MPERIPTTLPANPAAAEVRRLRRSPNCPVLRSWQSWTWLGELSVTCVSMGNPHCVTFVDELSDDWVLGVGPQIERHPHFPRRVNAEFVEVISPAEVRMRVWERGSGETLACGTGACASCVAGVLAGRTRPPHPRPSARRRPGTPLGRQQPRLPDGPGRGSFYGRVGGEKDEA